VRLVTGGSVAAVAGSALCAISTRQVYLTEQSLLR
jgi:hypothetical protein